MPPVPLLNSAAHVRPSARLGVRGGALLGSSLALAIALSACAEQELPELSPSAESGSEQLAEVNLRIRGDAVERSAGGLVAFHRMQSRVRECMAEHGEVYTFPRYVNYWAGLAIQPSHGPTSLLDPLDTDLGIAEQKSSPAVLYFATNGFGEGGEPRSPEFEAALDRCGHAGDSAHQTTPDVASDLEQGLASWVTQTTSEIGYRNAPYRECITAAGFEFTNNADLYEWVGSRFPSPLESPAAAGEASDAWKAAVELERRAAAADNECRADIVEEGMTLIEPGLDDWVASHEAELAAVDAAWADMVREAVQYPQWERVESGLALTAE